ncbi:MAG: DMT family transporter [Candidatus Saccharimonadales bacterium]
MIWIWLGLAGAIALGVTEYLTKRAYNHFDSWALAWFRNIFAIPVFATLLLSQGLPDVQSDFWKLLLIAAPLELVIGITFFIAIKLTPLSLVLPFTTFSTLFIIIGAFLINGESLKPIYLLSFVLILLGAYFIQEKRSINWRQLHTQKSELGIALMIFTTMLFGISVPLGERMVAASSPFFYLTVNFSIFVLLLTPIFLAKTSGTREDFVKRGRELLIIGLCNGLFLACLWLALSNGPAGPVSAINNLSIIVAVILAGTLLREQGLLRRLSATMLMVLGATVAVLG